MSEAHLSGTCRHSILQCEADVGRTVGMGCSVVLVPPGAVLFGEPVSLPLIGAVGIVRSAWFAEAVYMFLSEGHLPGLWAFFHLFPS